jgi:hypothetical protein
MKTKTAFMVPLEEVSDFSRQETPESVGIMLRIKLYRFNITQYLQRILDGNHSGK